MKLTCTSTGGPPTTVTWRKNGVLVNDSVYQQSQIVLNTTTATYENILYSDHIEDLVGSFTCRVINSQGNNSMTISSNGAYNYIIPLLLLDKIISYRCCY